MPRPPCLPCPPGLPCLPRHLISRREALAALASTTVLPFTSGCRAERAAVAPAATSEADARALLDDIGENLLRLAPEGATSLGIDTGARAGLRGQLSDRSAAGQQRMVSQLKRDLERASALDTSGLSHSTRTSVEVVRSAYATALQGFALPYGDVAVGGWRNTPYVVIQNVGAYLDVPRFLDSDHRIENAADAEAYLARLQSYARQLDGELGRMQAARGDGPGAARVSDRQGPGADGCVGEECPRRRRARRVHCKAHEGDSRQLGRARADDRGAGGCAGARAADRGAAGAACRGDQRRRDGGATARRGLLPLGAQSLDDH